MPPNNTFNPQQNKFPSIETVAAPTPLYKDSKFAGGGYQVGDPVKQIGRTADEQNYINLAEIAAGTSKSLDTFGSIASAVDKSKIERAGIEWEKINQNEDYSLEQKQQKLEEVFKNTNTPILGSNWKDQLQLQANKNWNSKEARDQFEQTRYTEEFAKYMTEHPGLIQTFKVLKEFDKTYEKKYPSSSSNTWFILKKSGNTTQDAENEIKTAIANLPSKVNKAFPLPTSDQVNAVLQDPNSEVSVGIRKKNPFFFENIDRARTQSFKDFNDYVYKAMVDNLKSFIGDSSEYTPQIKQAMLEELPNIATGIADNIYKLTGDYALKENERIAYENQKETLLAFTATPTIDNLTKVWDSVLVNSGNTTLTQEQRNDLILENIPELIKLWDKKANSQDRETVLSIHPNWNKMTPVQKVEAVFKHFLQWDDRLSDQAHNSLLKHFNLEDENQFENFLKIAKEKIANSKETEEATKIDYSKTVKTQLDQVKSRIGTLGLNPETENQLKQSYTSIANHYGIGVEELQLIFLDKDGNLTATKTAQEWLDSITDPVKKQRAIDSGLLNFNEFQFTGLKDGLIDILTGIQKTSADAANKDDSISNKAKSQLETLLASRSSEDLANSMLGGQFQKATENKELKGVVTETLNATLLLDDALKNNEINSEQGQAARSYLSAIYAKIPELQTVVISLQRDYYLLQMQTSALVESTPVFSTELSSLPQAEQDKIVQERTKEMQDELRIEFTNLVSGQIAFDGEPFRGTIKDKDGTWSGGARLHILQAALFSKKTFDRGSVADKKQWKEGFDTLITRIGNYSPKTLTSEEAKLDITTLAMMAREYKMAAAGGRDPVVYGAGYFQDRAILMGNWAEAYSVEQISRALNTTKFNERLQDAVFLPITFMRMQQTNRRYLDALQVGSSIKYFAYSSTKTISQVFNQSTLDENTGMFLGSVKPSSSNFDVRAAINVIKQEFGKKGRDVELSDESIATALEKHLGSAIPKTTVKPTSPDIPNVDQRIRTSLIALETIIGDNPTLFFNVSDTYFKGMEMKNTSLIPTHENKTQFDMFMHVLSMGLDLNRNQNAEDASSLPLETGAVHESILQGGRYTSASGLRTELYFDKAYDVKYRNDAISYGVATVIQGLNDLEFNPNELNDVLNTFTPAKNTNRGEEKKEDGVNFQFGSLLLDSKTVPIEARIELLMPWMNTQNQSLPQNLFDDIDPNLPLGEWLFEVNSKYIEYGGLRPFIKDGVTKEAMYEPGGSTLQQNGQLGSPATLLPTFSFFNKDNDGIPYIPITNNIIKSINASALKEFREKAAQKLTQKEKNRQMMLSRPQVGQRTGGGY